MKLITLDTHEEFNISKKLYSTKFNKILVHQLIFSYLSNKRKNISFPKNRSLIKGSNKKPWRQKGTGKARAGSFKSPIWRSGAVTFGGQYSNFFKKINKKMFKAGLRCIFSNLISLNKIILLNKIEIKKPKTKLLINYLNNFNIDYNVLIIENNINNNVYLASRNIHTIKICNLNNINPLLLIKTTKVMMTIQSLMQIENLLL